MHGHVCFEARRWVARDVVWNRTGVSISALNTQPLVLDAIKGKLDLSLLAEEAVVINEADVALAVTTSEKSPTPAATEEAPTKDVPLPDKTTPPSAVPAQPAGTSSEEPVQRSSDGDGTDAAKDTSHANTDVEPTDVKPPPSLETPQDDKPINLHGLPAASSLLHPPLAVGDRIFWYHDLHGEDGEWVGQEALYGSVQLISGSLVGALEDGKDPEDGFPMIAMSEVKLHREVSSEGAGLGLTSEPGVAAALAGSDAKRPIVLENVAVDAANAAILAAPPAATLSVVKSPTAQSIKDWTMS